eukprot:9887443-Ditylum_brightwellii.AAC.1
MAENDGKVTLAQKRVVSCILVHDKFVGLLHHHIIENYSAAKIDLLYGYNMDPISFGMVNDKDSEQEDDVVKLCVSKCEGMSSNDNKYIASQDSEELCFIDESYEVTTHVLIGADGSAQTIANAMEEFDMNHYSELNPFHCSFAPKPFHVTQYVDDNPNVYKRVPVLIPLHWPGGLNYSAQS